MAKQNNAVLKEYYSTSEVAHMVNLHRNTVILAIRSGKLPASKTPGGHARIGRKDLVHFAKEKGLPINFAIFPPASNGDRVLLVDDDTQIITIFSKGLKRANYQVAVASTGYEVGFAVRDFQPDIILLDLMLPDINGIEVCKQVRGDKRNGDVKILCISAVGEQSKIDAMLAAGADDFLPKPFTPETLVHRIVDLVGPIRTPAAS